MSLADNMRGERARMKWTQKKLADHLKVSESTIRKWESGKTVPCFKVADMALLFGCTTDYLLGLTDHPAA